MENDEGERVGESLFLDYYFCLCNQAAECVHLYHEQLLFSDLILFLVLWLSLVFGGLYILQIFNGFPFFQVETFYILVLLLVSRAETVCVISDGQV
jgi:hypothetical protein